MRMAERNVCDRNYNNEVWTAETVNGIVSYVSVGFLLKEHELDWTTGPGTVVQFRFRRKRDIYENIAPNGFYDN